MLLNGTKITGLRSGALCYTVHRMEITADGSPKAYGPNNKGLASLSVSTNVADDAWKFVIAANPAKPQIPFVQLHGTTAGYYVSETSLADRSKNLTDPARYVDAETVPYIVIPSHAELPGNVGIGDLAMVRDLDTEKQSAAVIADVGPPKGKPGEVVASFSSSARPS